MRTWKLAIVCLGVITPISSFAVVGAQFKDVGANASKRQVSYSLEQLAADPLLIQTLNISDEKKEQLLQQIVERAEGSDENSAQENEGLVHKAQYFFGGASVRGGYTPMAPYQDDLDDGLQCKQRKGTPKLPTPPAEPEVVFNADDMKNPHDWKVRYFDMVVVINKSASGQNMKVYRKLKKSDDLPVLVKENWKVSTGRETVEISNCDRRELNMPMSDHAPKNSYFSQTPTGYYTPGWLHIDHVSGDWEDAAMDHAVFFDLNRGIATHKVPNGAEGALGSRASGACIRMRQGDARELFWMIRATGGPISKTELAQAPVHCTKPEKREACLAHDKVRNKPKFANELKLALASGLVPYDETPSIPVFSREGRVMTYIDELGVEVPVMRKAVAKTLYIVENRFVPKAVPKKKKEPLTSEKKAPVKRAAVGNASVRGGLY